VEKRKRSFQMNLIRHTPVPDVEKKLILHNVLWKQELKAYLVPNKLCYRPFLPIPYHPFLVRGWRVDGGIMKKFEYDITKYPASEFTHLVYFCTDQGECKFDQIPDNQTRVLNEILNERGSHGWELVDLAFGNDGLVAFWKREIILS
jgi:hypothetical protein